MEFEWFWWFQWGLTNSDYIQIFRQNCKVQLDTWRLFAHSAQESSLIHLAIRKERLIRLIQSLNGDPSAQVDPGWPRFFFLPFHLESPKSRGCRALFNLLHPQSQTAPAWRFLDCAGSGLIALLLQMCCGWSFWLKKIFPLVDHKVIKILNLQGLEGERMWVTLMDYAYEMNVVIKGLVMRIMMDLDLRFKVVCCTGASWVATRWREVNRRQFHAVVRAASGSTAELSIVCTTKSPGGIPWTIYWSKFPWDLMALWTKAVSAFRTCSPKMWVMSAVLKFKSCQNADDV